MNTPRARREEVANALTHGAGLVASVAGGAALMVVAAYTRDPWQIVAAAIYAVSLVTLYAASTLYHSARTPLRRERLKLVDHCAIFGLIAGTYTPFTLGAMRGGWGWSLFAIVWILAVAGIAFKIFCIDRFRVLSVVLYLAMGWLVVFAIGPLNLTFSADVIRWIAAGGLLYSAGTIFYLMRRLPYGHAVWHLFVLGGSACHFAAILTQLLPHIPA